MSDSKLNGDLIYCLAQFISLLSPQPQVHAYPAMEQDAYRKAADQLCGALENWVKSVSPPGCGNHISDPVTFPEEVTIMVDDLKEMRKLEGL